MAGPEGRAGRRRRDRRGTILKRLEGLASEGEIRQAISDLETLQHDSPVISVAAIHVLKNELGAVEPERTQRKVLYQRTFILPGEREGSSARGPWRDAVDWLGGGGRERFRDECDRSFWERMVPAISAEFGDLAEPFMNTINEVIINYAEYSFKRWAVFRRISAQIFLTEDDLAYGIVRPQGLGQRVFDPLALKQKKAGTLHEMRRGWGHTLLMRRALFISFDHSPTRRGMMLVVGPEPGEPGAAGG